MPLTTKAILDFGEEIFDRAYQSEDAWDHLRAYEIIVHDVCVVLWWFRRDLDFNRFFELEFDGNQLAESLDEIGHRRGAVTMQLAHSSYLAGDEEACFVLAQAFGQMISDITAQLGFYIEQHRADAR